MKYKRNIEVLIDSYHSPFDCSQFLSAFFFLGYILFICLFLFTFLFLLLSWRVSTILFFHIFPGLAFILLHNFGLLFFLWRWKIFLFPPPLSLRSSLRLSFLCLPFSSFWFEFFLLLFILYLLNHQVVRNIFNFLNVLYLS